LNSPIKYTEEELVISIKGKDQDAFSYLYDNYAKALFGIIYKIVDDEMEAEDILQNVFIKIWNNFQSYDSSKGRLFTWMLNIARNSAIDSIRSSAKIKNNKIPITENTVSHIDQQQQLSIKTDHIGLNVEIAKLREDHRTLIDLAYYEGYTQEQIAMQLDIPLGTVKTKVRQALIILRKTIGK
jgi:RNA polymerase sigma-70 factor (ECF subfamily)